MFTVKNGRVYYESRPAYTRDLILPESILKEICFEEEEHSYSQMVVVDGMLIYVIKYKDSNCESLAGLWHFSYQRFEKSFFYESAALYLGP